jgi:outer membrane protein TolC
MLITYRACVPHTSKLSTANAYSRLGLCSKLLLATLAATTPLHAQTPLTLAAAQRLAVAHSQQLAAQDSMAASAREMAIAAGQLPDPVLRLGVDNVPVNGTDRFSLGTDFMTMRRIGVMQEFIRSDKRKLKAERFEREADRAITEKAAVTAEIQKLTALAWLDRFYLERMRSAVAAQADETKFEIEAAESAYRAGRGSQADVYVARSSRAALDDRLSEFDRRIRNARAMLARWIGTTADAALEGEPDFKSIPFSTHALDDALIRHPAIAVLQRQVEAAQTETQLAKANKQTDWSVEVAYQERGPAFSNMFSIGIAIPLQWDQKNRQDREVAAKVALTDRAKAQQEDALRNHVAEVRTMINEWENGLERIARYERELAPLARERTQAALAAYRSGKSDLNAVLAARKNEIEIRTQALQIAMDTARTWAQLNFLVPDEDHSAHLEPAVSKEAK